ncbi:MAG: FUSC family protein, partial [Actinocatenispora sp.]
MAGRGREVGQRSEVTAPDWIVQLVRLKPTAVPWLDMARMAVAIPTPVGVGILLGVAPLGVLAAMGALATSIADRGGPLRLRLLSQLGTGAAGAVGLSVGHLAAGTGWPSVLFVAATALVSGLLSVVSAAASQAGLQLLVYMSIASGLTVPVAPYELPVLYVFGALWAMLLSTLAALVVGTRTPERDAVADVYQGVAELLGAAGTDRMVDVRQRLTDTMNSAYDALLSVRSRSAGRNPVFRQLAALLNAATQVVEASVAVAHHGRRPPAEVAATVRDLARSIRTGEPAPELPTVLRETDSYRLRALRTGITEVREQLGAHEASIGPLLPSTMRERLTRLADRVLTGPNTWLSVARLVLCMSLAEVLRGVLPLQRSYWVLLTVAIVLKPDFGSVFARGVQRGLGTLIGVLIGAGVLVVVPGGAWLLPPMAAAAALLPLGRARNYGMFAIFLTPLATMLVDFSTHEGPQIVVTRLLDTLAGCALTLVFGYLLWPETWRVRLGAQVADAVDGIGDYLREAFGAESAARAQRRRAYRTLSDMRTAFQRQLAEPPPMSTNAAAWWPMIVQLERAVDAITAAAVQARSGGRVPAAVAVDLLVADVRGLAAALREHRSPEVSPLPEDEAL